MMVVWERERRGGSRGGEARSREKEEEVERRRRGRWNGVLEVSIVGVFFALRLALACFFFSLVRYFRNA